MTGFEAQTVIRTGILVAPVLVLCYCVFLYVLRSSRGLRRRLFFRRYEVMADTSLDCICVLGRDLRFDAVNASFCNYVGKKRELVIGNTLGAICSPGELEWVTQKVAECLQGCALIERHALPSGRDSTCVYEVSFYPFTPKGAKRPSHAVIYLKDISDYLAKEAELEAEREKALAASKAKGDFLASMSHEIRTPINAIIGLTELALKRELEAELRDDLETVKAVSATLLAIVNDILDFSRIEAGKLTLEKSTFSLPDTLSHVVKAFQPTAAAKGIGLELELDRAIPAQLRGDSLRLGQILYNLIGNAIKFTERGGVVVSLSPLRRIAAGDRCWISLEVRDTGIGIPPEKLGTIFESFSQGDAGTARRYGGSGLGLTISRELARMFDGDLRAESTPGCGSSFIAELSFEIPSRIEPLSPGNHSAGIPVSAPLPASPLHGQSPTQPESIYLLVEDNDINAKVILRLMRSLGYEGDWAQDGPAALRQLSSHDYAFVFMDIQMPVMDGWEVVSRIRAGEAGEAARSVRIAAMTAHASPEVSARCAAAGMVFCLTKPIAMDHLRSIVPQLLERSCESPVLDLSKTLERFEGDWSLVEEIVGIFRAEAPERVSAALKAFEAGDWMELQSLSHKVRGAAAAMGAMRLSAVAGELERALRDHDGAATSPSFDAFLKVYALTVEALSHPLNQGGAVQG